MLLLSHRVDVFAIAGDDGLVKIYEFVHKSESPVLIAIGDGHFTHVSHLMNTHPSRQLFNVCVEFFWLVTL